VAIGEPRLAVCAAGHSAPGVANPPFAIAIGAKGQSRIARSSSDVFIENRWQDAKDNIPAATDEESWGGPGSVGPDRQS
jgi:hypothetical protein